MPGRSQLFVRIEHIESRRVLEPDIDRKLDSRNAGNVHMQPFEDDIRKLVLIQACQMVSVNCAQGNYPTYTAT